MAVTIECLLGSLLIGPGIAIGFLYLMVWVAAIVIGAQGVLQNQDRLVTEEQNLFKQSKMQYSSQAFILELGSQLDADCSQD